MYVLYVVEHARQAAAFVHWEGGRDGLSHDGIRRGRRSAGLRAQARQAGTQPTMDQSDHVFYLGYITEAMAVKAVYALGSSSYYMYITLCNNIAEYKCISL